MQSPTRMKAVVEGMANLPAGGRVETALQKAADAYEVRHAAYIGLSIGPLTRNGIFDQATYRASWKERYRTRNYAYSDPVVQQATNCLLPFDWRMLEPNSKLSLQVMHESEEFGVGPQGLSVTIRGLHGDVAVFSVNADEPDRHWSLFAHERLAELNMLAMHFHELVLREHGIVRARPSLTPRQIECLRWLAAGKSIDDIGDIIGLSPKSVANYLDNARDRLNALNRPHAAAIAVSRGLVPAPE